MMAQKLSHFIFNSDYPIDKVVFYKQQKITIPAKSGGTNGTLTVNIPHNLEFTPLPIAVWATTPDFTDTRTMEPFPYDIGMETLTADAAKITATFESSKASATTAYLRVYGLLPQDSIYEAPQTARQSANLVFDTDKVYVPLIFSGMITTDFDSTNVKNINVTHGYKELITTANRLVVEHNLGDYPYMLLWQETISTGEIALSGFPTISYGYPDTMYNTSDATKCSIYCGQSQGQHKWHIRIYANV